MEYDGCRYSITNEKLEAILRGLEITPKDNILSICGSGDQPLALLEIAKEITTIDSELNQIELFKHRKEIILSREYSRFRNVYCGIAFYDLPPRNEYFSDERLDRIRKNLDNSKIETICGNIFKKNLRKSFTKIYLSNALLFNDSFNKETEKRLRKISKRLSKGGLVYITDGDRVIERMYNFYPLQINEILTVKAREVQKPRNGHEQLWSPIILQKIN
jgi:hypothetical protein